MGISALTFGFTAVQSSTLPNANALTTATGTGTTTSTATLVGTATGFGPLYSQGTTQAWPALLALDDPSGHGWVLDSTALEQQNIPGGVWSGALSIITSVGTLIADVYVRIGVYHSASGAYTLLGSLVAPGVTLQTTGTVNLSGTLGAVNLTAGDKLYADIWLNISSNGTGSGAATVSVSNLATTLYITNAWTTPGYQPLTEAQRSVAYAYGGFVLHDGLNYIVTEKGYPYPQVRETLFKIARMEGMKKTGEVVNDVTLGIKVRVIGASRADLEMKLDALYQALSRRQQNLTLHSVDGRYYVCDAVAAQAPLPRGNILSTEVPISFLAQQPYPLAAAASTYSYPSTALALVSGSTYQTGVHTFAGGGTIYSRPIITISNNTPSNNTTLGAALTQNTAYTSLTVAALPAAATSGQVFTLTNGVNTQQVTLSANALQGATTLSVVNFTANYSYPATTTTVDLVTTITSITIQQNPDGQTLTIPNLTFPNGGAYLLITCDPTVGNGYTVLLNGTGSPLAFSGVFPVQEPTPTQWNVQAVCLNQPTVSVVWSWTARYLS
jgi:hypothetical protein